MTKDNVVDKAVNDDPMAQTTCGTWGEARDVAEGARCSWLITAWPGPGLGELALPTNGGLILAHESQRTGSQHNVVALII